MRLKEKVRTVVVEDLDSLSRDLASLEAETEDEGGQTTDILFQVGGGDTENGEPTVVTVPSLEHDVADGANWPSRQSQRSRRT